MHIQMSNQQQLDKNHSNKMFDFVEGKQGRNFSCGLAAVHNILC